MTAEDHETTAHELKVAFLEYAAMAVVAVALAIGGAEASGFWRPVLSVLAALVCAVTVWSVAVVGGLAVIAYLGSADHYQAPVRHQRVRRHLERRVTRLRRRDQILVATISIPATLGLYSLIDHVRRSWYDSTFWFPFGPGGSIVAVFGGAITFLLATALVRHQERT